MAEIDESSWAAPGEGEPAAAPEEATPAPSNVVAALAALLPLIFPMFACGLWGVAVRFEVMDSVRMMGMAPLALIVGATGVAILGTSVTGFLAAKGKRVPAAIALFLAALPWLGSLVGEALGMSMVERALEHASPDMRATLMAAGIAEATQARVLGAMLASGTFAAVAVGFGVGALNQRAPRRRVLVGLLLTLPMLPLLGLAAWSLYVGRGAALGIVLAVVGALLAVALGAAGVGADPKGRSGALGAAAAVAAALSVAAAAVAGITASFIMIFSAVAHADPASRSMLMSRGLGELIPLDWTRSAAIGLGLLTGAAIAGWGASRVRPSVGRIVGAGAVLAVLGLVLGADALSRHQVERAVAGAAAPALSGVDGFEAARLEGGSYEGELVDGSVTAAGLHDADGAALAPLERAALTDALRALVGSREARLEEVRGRDRFEPEPEWLREEEATDGTRTAPPPTEPQLELALDRRLDAAALRTLVLAASDAGARSLMLHGALGEAPPEEAREMVESIAPVVVPFLTSQASVVVRLGPSIPAELPARDPRLLHAEVGEAPIERASAREGAEVDPDDLDLRRVGYGRRASELEGELVYLRVGDGATAASAMESASRAARRGLEPVLVAGELPGDPGSPLDVAPEPPPVGGILGALADEPGGVFRGRGRRRGEAPTARPGSPGSGGSGAEVRGSLSRDAIQRVVRRHTNEVRYCYERGLSRDPSLSGRVTVSFVIAATGAVQSATVRESTLGDAEVEGCIARAAQRWRFPPPDGGGIVVVNYPFVLNQG